MRRPSIRRSRPASVQGVPPCRSRRTRRRAATSPGASGPDPRAGTRPAPTIPPGGSTAPAAEGQRDADPAVRPARRAAAVRPARAAPVRAAAVRAAAVRASRRASPVPPVRPAAVPPSTASRSTGQPQYGQPPYGPQYGQPAYGAAPVRPASVRPAWGPPGGPGQPPKKSRNTVIALVVGAVLVLAAIGAGLFFLLRAGDPAPGAAASERLLERGRGPSEPAPTGERRHPGGDRDPRRARRRPGPRRARAGVLRR